MGAMKAIYTDIQELQEAALTKDEPAFIDYVQESGWMSPTEGQILRQRLADLAR